MTPADALILALFALVVVGLYALRHPKARIENQSPVRYNVKRKEGVKNRWP